MKQKLHNSPRALVLLVLLSFFLSFDRFPTFELGGLNVKISTILGVGIICIAAHIVLKNPRTGLAKLSPFVFLGLWMLWMLFGVFWARDTTLFLKSLIPLAFLTILTVSIVVVWKKNYLRPVLIGLIAGAITSMIFGVFQFVGNFMGLSDAITLIRPEYSWQGFGFPRVHSFSVEPLYFAGYLILPISLLLAGLITKSIKPKWYTLTVLVAGVSMVIATLSRGGMLALFLAVLLQGILLRKQILKLLSWRLVLYATMGMVISFVLVLGTFAVFNKQGDDTDLTYGKRGVSTVISHLANTRFAANKDNKAKDDSIAQRDTARSQGYDLAVGNGVLFVRGTGIGQYGVWATEKYGVMFKGEPNNFVVEQLAQGGIVGLTLLVVFFLTVFKVLYRNRSNWVSVATLSYLAAILLQAQSFHGLLITHFWVALGIGLAVATQQESTSSRQDSSTASAKHLRTSA